MSEPVYEDFELLIGRLKRAAIDAYMDDAGFQPGSDSYSRVDVVPVIGAPSSTTTWVTRPGENGEGGGDSTTQSSNWFPMPGSSYRQPFDQVRSAIDGLVAPWRDLPDPAVIESVEDACVALISRLAGTAAYSQGHVSGVGIISTNLSQVHTNAVAFTGRTGEAFKSNFLGRVGAVCGGLWAISLLAGTTVHAQRELWKYARSDVATIMARATAAMDASCTSAQQNLSMQLTVAGVVVKVAKEFVSGVGGGALGVAGVAIDLLQDATAAKADPVPLGASTYQGVLDNLSNALGALSAEIAVEEQLIDATLVKNMNTIEATGRTLRYPQPGAPAQTANPYDLQVPAIADTKGVKITSFELVEGIWRECLPKIARELDDLAVASQNCSTYHAVQRDDSIGMGFSGPSANFSALTWLLYEMEKDLAWDVTTGAKNLELVVEAFKEHDRASAAKLKEYAETMAAPAPYDPWD